MHIWLVINKAVLKLSIKIKLAVENSFNWKVHFLATVKLSSWILMANWNPFSLIKSTSIINKLYRFSLLNIIFCIESKSKIGFEIHQWMQKLISFAHTCCICESTMLVKIEIHFQMAHLVETNELVLMIRKDFGLLNTYCVFTMPPKLYRSINIAQNVFEGLAKL